MLVFQQFIISCTRALVRTLTIRTGLVAGSIRYFAFIDVLAAFRPVEFEPGLAAAGIVARAVGAYVLAASVVGGAFVDIDAGRIVGIQREAVGAEAVEAPVKVDALVTAGGCPFHTFVNVRTRCAVVVEAESVVASASVVAGLVDAHLSAVVQLISTLVYI